ncbi:Chfr [Symbiodinium sp. CCMP2592]|nr:Chfr [Symbiodinium sp. CCMP2592]
MACGFLVPCVAGMPGFSAGRFPLPQSGATTIGRKATCSIVCQDETVSGLHCTVFSDLAVTPRVELEDVSTNGTFLDDIKLQKGVMVPLAAGAVIRLGARIRFRLQLCTEPLVLTSRTRLEGADDLRWHGTKAGRRQRLLNLATPIGRRFQLSEGWPPILQFQWTVLVISSMFACVPCLDVYTLYAGCCR